MSTAVDVSIALRSRGVGGSSLTWDAWCRLRRNTLAMFGSSVIALLIFLAVAGPWVAPYDPLTMFPDEQYQGPTLQHLMGTDEYGRDLLSRVIYGARLSLSVAVISVSISLALGTALGLAAGYFLGIVDMVISRLVDVLYSFPAILLALVVISVLGPGMDRVMIAIGLAYTPLFIRVCRGSVIGERGKLYVDAALSVGARPLRILGRHILPNVLPPLIVQASLCMSYAVLTEAALSFLGLGTRPPTPSWGVMLSKGRGLIEHSPWLSIWPGLAIMAVVFGFNTLGDGLRDALDPRLRGSSAGTR